MHDFSIMVNYAGNLIKSAYRKILCVLFNVHTPYGHPIPSVYVESTCRFCDNRCVRWPSNKPWRLKKPVEKADSCVRLKMSMKYQEEAVMKVKLKKILENSYK